MMTQSIFFLRACALLAALALGACAYPINGPEDAKTVEQRFPITVEPHMEMVRLPFNAARGGLDQASSADLERFARDYLDNGSGALAIAGSLRNPDASRMIADRLVALDSLSEANHQLLIRLHAANDDRASALRAYHQCMRVLRRELGVEPGQATRELFEREYLDAQIMRFGGNISRTAAFIGMERSALHRKLKSLGFSGARIIEETAE